MFIRPITETDFPAIQALHRHVGWPERSPTGWRWLHANPARHDIGAPAGWVVEGADGAPAAFAGNLIQRFRLGDQMLHGASGFSIIVTPPARGASRAIIRTFLDQAGVFAAYTFNANPTSQPLYLRHGMRPWPEQTHALKLSWTIDPAALALGRVFRETYRLAPGPVSGWGERLMNDRLGGAPDLDLPPGVTMLTDLRDRSRYGDFWTALSGEGRLLADRSPSALRWRLADPDLTTRPVILAFNRGQAVTGYAMALLAKANTLEAPVLEILDLEALDRDDAAIPAMMKGLRLAARALGAAKLRCQVVSPRLLRRLGVWGERARREGGWGHCHVRFSIGAPDPDLWSPTPLDGDYAICLRPVPLGAKVAAREPAPARPTASKA